MSAWRGRPVHVYDMGRIWTETTGLPMVFAVWAAKNIPVEPSLIDRFAASARWGAEHVEEIVAQEAPARGLAPELVRRYITEHICYELGERERDALEFFLAAAADLDLIDEQVDAPAVSARG